MTILNMIRSETKATATAILFLFVLATVASTPIASAHDPAWEVPTWAYMSVTPNLVGVDQSVVIVMWLNNYPPTANGQYGDRWHDFEITVTKPDGSTETLGPFNSDPVGSAFTSYTPTLTGTYKFVFSWPGQVIDGLPVPPGQTIDTIRGAATVGDHYLGSASDPVYLDVQADPIDAYQETPVPEGYWTRPVHGANRNWYAVTASWLGPSSLQKCGSTSNFAYGTAPESAHVLWTLPYYSGGVMDARFGSNTYYTGLSYERYWSNPIILNGKLYFNDQTNPREGWYCVDLRSGTIDYFHNTTGPVVSGGSFSGTGSIPGQSLSFGQIYNYDSPNQHGGFAYLWSTNGYQDSGTWDMFDQFSGAYVCSIANVTQRVTTGSGTVTIGATGTQVYGVDGSILYYNIVNLGSNANPNYHLQIWNNTYAIWYKELYTSNDYWFWRPNLNQTFDGRNGFSLDVQIQDMTDAGRVYEVREGEYIIGGTAGKNNGTYIEEGQLWALSLEQGKEGTLLWNITYTPPETVYPDTVAGNVLSSYPYGLMSGPYLYPEEGVFVFTQPMTREWWGYDLAGNQIWGPTEPMEQWNFYGMTYNFYDGMLLSCGYGGELIAFDVQTGHELWRWESGNVGFENYYGGNAPLSFGAIADGKIYLYSTEHSPNTPLRRDAFLWCVDAYEGTLLWKIQCWANGLAIGDGYAITLDSNDNQIYCFGVGPSETTVTVSPKVADQCAPVLIEGTVTDQSPGAMGTPAISDADQQAWMEYIYQQRPMPQTATGVTVHLTAIDPNNNLQDIGTAVSDIGGSFALAWTPPVPGTYKVTATFEGSAAYGNSYATTYFTVGDTVAASVTPDQPGPSETTPPTQPTPTPIQSASPSVAPPPTSEMPTTTYIAIGIAIAVIVVAAAVLVLRKRA
ncbi:MAG: hypothetical protein NWF04_08030 [Candidatus Bathyarchaeota archaeon]|nr:hypothetical protein [Candidatus Bathyarchaeota archaeon]